MSHKQAFTMLFHFIINLYHKIIHLHKEFVRPLISESASKSLVCSLVTSRFDYGNGLLRGVCTSSLSRIQRIKNTATRIITRTGKYDHITPMLVKLHWLPIEQWITGLVFCYFQLFILWTLKLIETHNLYKIEKSE